MKAIQVNGAIKTFASLPKVWTDENGTHVNIKDGEAYGFYDIVIPNYSGSHQELGDIYFDIDNNVFTYPVNDITFNESIEELKNEKISSLKEAYKDKLKVTDWYIIRKQDTNEDIPQEVIDERANLRSEYKSHKLMINSLTTKISVVSYNF